MEYSLIDPKSERFSRMKELRQSVTSLQVKKRSTHSAETNDRKILPEDCRKKCKCSHKSKKSRGKCKYLIHKHHFCGGKGVVLTQPGKYCLTSDVNFKPTQGTDAILIATDNIVLDLCGHTLRQDNVVDGCAGIRVATGHKNVTILGSYGKIADFSTFGIRVEAGSEGITIGDETKLVVTNCGKVNPGSKGWFVFFLANPGSAGGIYVGDTLANGDPLWGLVTKNVKLQNVHTTDNSWTGLAILSSLNVLVDSCTISENTALVDAYGDSAALSCFMHNYPPLEPRNKNVVIRDSVFTNNTNENLPYPSFFNVTYSLYASLEDFTIERCSFSNNKSFGRVWSALLTWSDCGKFIDCDFCGNEGGWSVTGVHFSGNYGDVVETVNNVDFVRCNASDNVANYTDETLSVGFSVEYASGFQTVYGHDVHFLECQGNSNKFIVQEGAESSPGGGFAWGYQLVGTFGSAEFGSFPLTDNSLVNCKASNNEVKNVPRNVDPAVLQGLAQGLLIGIGDDRLSQPTTDTNRVLVQGGQYNHNISELSDGYGIRFGFWLGSNYTGHVVKGASVEANTTDGIMVRQNTNTSVFDSNYIINNGGVGINLTGDKCVVRNNVLIANTGGNIVDGGVANVLVNNTTIA